MRAPRKTSRKTSRPLSRKSSRKIKQTDGSRSRGSARITLVIATATLLLVAGVTVPLVRTRHDAAREQQARADMARLGDAITRYHTDSGIWPANANLDFATSATHKAFEPLQGFSCLFTNVHREDGWNGPYLDGGLKEGGRYVVSSRSSDPDGMIDPWGHRYYVGHSGERGPLGERGGVYLLCLGKNGEIDTGNPDLIQGHGGGDDLVFVARPAKDPNSAPR